MVIVVVLVEGACVDARLLREIFPQVRTEIISGLRSVPKIDMNRVYPSRK